MQPHSMCALGMAGYVWANVGVPCPTSATMKVIYMRDGYYKTNVYYLSNIKESNEGKKLEVNIVRGGGGIACTITAERHSTEEGSEVTMTHSQQHIAGLREVVRISRTRIAEGKHYNSLKYGRFSGDFTHPEKKRMLLQCEVKRDDGSYVTVPYMLEISSVS